MVIKKEETYVLKLTEYREILDVLKTGDINLVSKLMDDLKDIDVRYKRVNAQKKLKNNKDYIDSQDYIFEFVSIFYSYEENSFRAKIRHDKYKDPYLLEEFIELKDNFNHVGVDINVTGKPTVDKILKIFTSTSLNKKEKAVKILDLINKSVNKSLVFESQKITQTALDDKKRFKRLLFSSNINLDYVLKDNFFNEVFKDIIDKIIKQDIKKPDNNLIVERDLYNPYKLGELHFILQNKEAAKLALKSMDLVKRKDKTVDVGYLYTKNLIDFIGGMLISNTITSLTDEEKFSILSEKIPESCSIRIGSDYYLSSDVSNIGFICGDFEIEKVKGLFDEVINFADYLKTKNENKARVVIRFLFTILNNNEVMEEQFAVNYPEMFAKLFKLRYELFGNEKHRSVNPDFYYRIDKDDDDSLFSEKLSILKGEFEKLGLNLFLVLDEPIKFVWNIDQHLKFNRFVTNLAKETNSKILVDLFKIHSNFDRLSIFYESIRTLSKVLTKNKESELCIYLGGLANSLVFLDNDSVRLFTGDKKTTKSVISTLDSFANVNIDDTKEEDTKMFSSQCLINNLSILTDHFYEPVNKFDPLN